MNKYDKAVLNKASSIPAGVDAQRRKFLKDGSSFSLTALAISTLPMATLLTGCGATFHGVNFANWSGNIRASNIMLAEIFNETDAQDIVQWANELEYTVRPVGEMHNWSPLVIDQHTKSSDSVVLVDSSALNSIAMVEAQPTYGVVKVGAGALMEDIHKFLSDHRSSGGSPSGYAFQNAPAPGDLTIAGVLAINGHGTGVPYDGSVESPHFNGSVSNLILSITAIVWNSATSQYEARTFHRDEIDTDVFLTHLGRILITEVTLQVVPNINLRCQSYTEISWKELFHQDPNNSQFTVHNILNSYGRMETIWFPFTEYPWLKIWKNSPTKPAESTATTAPYNYGFSQQIPLFASEAIKVLLYAYPHLVPPFGLIQYFITHLSLNGTLNINALTEAVQNLGMSGDDTNILMQLVNLTGMDSTQSSGALNDLWGPAHHTTLYVRKDTLRVTANGYAIHVPRAGVQTLLHDFAEKFVELLGQYQDRGQFPVAGPMEIRVTGLEDTSGLKTRNGVAPPPPAISALTKSTTAANNIDTAVWLDLLAFPDAPGSALFYHEIEQWLYNRYPADQVRVEWSKGWGYNESGDGPWTDQDVLKNKIPNSFSQTPRTFANTAAVLQSYDPQNVYNNKLHDELFG